MTLMPSTRNAPPHAGAMLEALRGLGYSTAAALADIVDNSISAGATEVRIHFVWAGEASRMTVLDNGRGMDDADLERAMTLGDKNPLTARAENDLGRFGMGLKTASFFAVSAADGGLSNRGECPLLLALGFGCDCG